MKVEFTCTTCQHREEGLAAMKAACVDKCGHAAELVIWPTREG